MSSKKPGLVRELKKEFRHAEHAFSDIIKKKKLKEKALVAINTERAKEGMRDWAKDWRRKKPRWTSVYYLEDAVPLKLMQGYYRKFGFATRVRKGKGKSKAYYLDIFGWNSWCHETGIPMRLPNKAEKKRLKKVC